MIKLASLKLRLLVNFVIGGLIFVLGIIFIGSVLLLVFNIISLIYLILFIPVWIFIFLFEREFILTLVFLLKKAPYSDLGKSSGKHEKILEDYLKTLNNNEGES